MSRLHPPTYPDPVRSGSFPVSDNDDLLEINTRPSDSRGPLLIVSRRTPISTQTRVSPMEDVVPRYVVGSVGSVGEPVLLYRSGEGLTRFKTRNVSGRTILELDLVA